MKKNKLLSWVLRHSAYIVISFIILCITLYCIYGPEEIPAQNSRVELIFDSNYKVSVTMISVDGHWYISRGVGSSWTHVESCPCKTKH